MSYHISLPMFEGPFDLLFHLIESEEIDIWDIPIARITEQYLEYIVSLAELDLSIAGEFLVMAATLLAIKARLLLPVTTESTTNEEEQQNSDPRLSLVARLLEYRRFKEAGLTLSQLASGRDKLYPRGYARSVTPVKPLFTRPIGDVTLAQLAKAMQTVQAIYEPPASTTAIPGRRLSVIERIDQLQRLLLKKECMSFSDLFSSQATRADIVVTFLALLELVRQGLCVAVQQQQFGPIELSHRQQSVKGVASA